MGKRSPILGYNHNVRHRGLLFHVQTEDSGVDNPHIFTHLFHGGVIISTRRLDYDAGSAEDVVKALMQAQHKATLKELKGAVWDQKIDAYLGTHPDLLPAVPARREGRDTMVEPPPPFDEAGGPVPVEPRPPEPSPAAAGTNLGEALSGASEPPAPLARGTGGDMPVEPAASAAQAGRSARQDPAVGPGQPLRGDEVSAAFRAISVDEGADDPGAAPSAPLEADDAATTQRLDRVDLAPPPARPTAPQATPPPTPPRARQTSGAYHQRRRIVDRMPEIHDQPTAPLPRDRARSASSAPKAAGTPPPVPRQSTPPIPIAPRPGRGVNAIVRPAGKAHAPAQPPPRAAGRARMPPVPPARAAQGQVRASVVVSRPAVIVGGPPRVIAGGGGRGNGSPGSDPPRALGGRRAREEPSRPKLFGKDLISEKSLDEVILAYLSEDSGSED